MVLMEYSTDQQELIRSGECRMEEMQRLLGSPKMTGNRREVLTKVVQASKILTSELEAALSLTFA